MHSQVYSKKQILWFSLSLSLLLAAPFFKQQLLTGTIVNALLFISLIVFGKRTAVFFALLPSLLSLVLAFVHPMLVPLIMLSNLVLLACFSWVYKREGFFLGVFFAGLVKTGFLLFSATFFLNDVLGENVLKILSPIQLVTAWGGGVLAYFVVRKKL
jgi:hypothetical protein